MKAQVAERALVGRIRRNLSKNGKSLCACKFASRNWISLGNWYIVDNALNGVIATHCDLETLGRELKVLKDYEELADENSKGSAE